MEEKPQENKKLRWKQLLLAAIIAVAAVLGGRWFYYVAFADSPFDEVGIQINALMPGPINRFGCDLLEQRFGTKTMPPMGCGKDGKW